MNAHPAGIVRIRLERTSAGLECRIASSRPTGLARAFVGRTADETSALLPRLFSVCARAQASACAAALGAAVAVPSAPGRRALRAAAVDVETLREHLWRILLDWPALLDGSGGVEAAPAAARVAMAGIMARVQAVQAALDPDGGLFRLAADDPPKAAVASRWRAAADGRAALAELAGRHVFGMPPDRWLDRVGDRAALIRWAVGVDTGAACLIRALAAADLADVGAVPVHPLPAPSAAALIARLSGTGGAAFAAQPEWDGLPRETTALTRRGAQPLLADPVAGAGVGLLGRLAAVLLEVALLADAPLSFPDAAFPADAPPPFPEAAPSRSPSPLEAAGGRANAGSGWPPPFQSPPPGDVSARAPPSLSDLCPPGIGLGVVAAARGLLIHLARVENGLVTDYRILAPTEWNFHPRGIVVRALSALPERDPPTRRRLAEALILAIDPCVAFELTLEDQATVP